MLTDNNVHREYDFDMCTLKEIEKNAIIRCIEKCDGNITEASKILGINRSTIYSKLKSINNNNYK